MRRIVILHPWLGGISLDTKLWISPGFWMLIHMRDLAAGGYMRAGVTNELW